VLPWQLGSCSPNLCHVKGRSLTPASGEGNVHVRGSTASDDQRLKAPRGGTRIRPCNTLGVDTGVIDLALEGRLCKESESGQSEPSKRWRGEGSCSTGRLGGSSQRGGSLHTSEAPGPPGVVCEQVTRWSSRTGRTVDSELEPTPFSRAVGSSSRTEVSSTARGGGVMM
jgi:hypothetical protein